MSDTRPIDSRWSVGRGCIGQGGGCNAAGQGQLISEITFSVEFALFKISRYLPTYQGTKTSYRSVLPATKNV